MALLPSGLPGSLPTPGSLLAGSIELVPTGFAEVLWGSLALRSPVPSPSVLLASAAASVLLAPIALLAVGLSALRAAALVALAWLAVALWQLPSSLLPGRLLLRALRSIRRSSRLLHLPALVGSSSPLTGPPLGPLPAVDVLPAALAPEAELFLGRLVVEGFVAAPLPATAATLAAAVSLRPGLSPFARMAALLVAPAFSSRLPSVAPLLVLAPPAALSREVLFGLERSAPLLGLPPTVRLTALRVAAELTAAPGAELTAALDARLVALSTPAAVAAAGGALPVEPVRSVLLAGLAVLVDRALPRSAAVVGRRLAPTGPAAFVPAEPAALVGRLAVAAPAAPVLATGSGVAVTIPRPRRTDLIVLPGASGSAALRPAVAVVLPPIDVSVVAVDSRPVVVDCRIVSLPPSVRAALAGARTSRVPAVALVAPVVGRTPAPTVAELAIVSSPIARPGSAPFGRRCPSPLVGAGSVVALFLVPSVVGWSV